jgi:hypothetical protein
MKTTPSVLPGEAPRRPPYWERLVLYAYGRMTGSTQKDAAAAVGRKKRTAQDWEADKVLYAQAREEAKQRWLGELADASRQALLSTIRGGHGELALKVLERLDSELAPAAHRLKHEGAVDLTLHPAWLTLRMQILQILAPYPAARAELAELLSDDTRNGAGH